MWALLAWHPGVWLDGAWLGMDEPEIPPEPLGVSAGGFPMRIPKKGEYAQRQRRRRDESLLLSLLR